MSTGGMWDFRKDSTDGFGVDESKSYWHILVTVLIAIWFAACHFERDYFHMIGSR